MAISSNAITSGFSVLTAISIPSVFPHPVRTSVSTPISFCGTPSFTAAISPRVSTTATRFLAVPMPHDISLTESRKRVVFPDPGGPAISRPPEKYFESGMAQFLYSTASLMLIDDTSAMPTILPFSITALAAIPALHPFLSGM